MNDICDYCKDKVYSNALLLNINSQIILIHLNEYIFRSLLGSVFSRQLHPLHDRLLGNADE